MRFSPCLTGGPSTQRFSTVFRRAFEKFKALSRKRRNAVAIVPISKISLSDVVQLAMPHLSVWQPPKVSGESITLTCTTTVQIESSGTGIERDPSRDLFCTSQAIVPTVLARFIRLHNHMNSHVESTPVESTQ